MTRVVCKSLLGLCLAALCSVTLLPIGWKLNRAVVAIYYFFHNLGAPAWFTIDVCDYLLNVVLFAAPTAAAIGAWPLVRRWVWAVVAMIVSAMIELTQWLFLPREGSWVDVSANTLGAVLTVSASLLVKTHATTPAERTAAREGFKTK